MSILAAVSALSAQVNPFADEHLRKYYENAVYNSNTSFIPPLNKQKFYIRKLMTGNTHDLKMRNFLIKYWTKKNNNNKKPTKSVKSIRGYGSNSNLQRWEKIAASNNKPWA